jgi:hypothetical protein
MAPSYMPELVEHRQLVTVDTVLNFTYSCGSI